MAVDPVGVGMLSGPEVVIVRQVVMDRRGQAEIEAPDAVRQGDAGIDGQGEWPVQPDPFLDVTATELVPINVAFAENIARRNAGIHFEAAEEVEQERPEHRTGGRGIMKAIRRQAGDPAGKPFHVAVDWLDLPAYQTFLVDTLCH